MRFGTAILIFLVMFSPQMAFTQTVEDQLKTLEEEIQRLKQQIEALSREAGTPGAAQEGTPPAESPTKATNRDFADQILVPDLGGDEREHKLEGRPEIFLQTRFSRNRLPEADPKQQKKTFN
jgi:hypothetical protein